MIKIISIALLLSISLSAITFDVTAVSGCSGAVVGTSDVTADSVATVTYTWSFSNSNGDSFTST